MLHNLYDSDDGQVFRTHDWFYARGTQVRSGTSEELAGRPPALQLAHEFGGIVVAGGFSGRDQYGARR